MLPDVRCPVIEPPPGIKFPGSAPKIVFRSANLRVWGKKSVLSFVDQGLTSAAGFGVNILLARWVSAEVYGAFAVAFAAFLFVSGFHSVLSLEPLSVFGPARHAHNLPQYFRTQLIIHSILVGTLSGFVLLAAFAFWTIAPGNPLIPAATGCAVATPFLLLLWLARRMCYVLQRPAIAIFGSSTYLAFSAAGLFLLAHFQWLGSFSAFLLMGLGSLLAAGVLISLLGLLNWRVIAGHAISWRDALRENWSYGRWLVGSVVLFSVSSQTQTFLAAATLGLGAAGVLRAMQIPALAMTQVVTATGLLVLPALSYDFGQGFTERIRHKAKLVSAALLVVTLSFAALLAAEASRVEHILYGGKYARQAWLIPILALIPVVNGVSIGFSMALRASQKPRFDLVSNLFAAPVAIVSAFVFMRLWGLPGAAASMLLSFIVLCAVTLAFFHKSARHKTLAAAAAGVAP